MYEGSGGTYTESLIYPMRYLFGWSTDKLVAGTWTGKVIRHRP